jgi:hypothetical protein
VAGFTVFARWNHGVERPGKQKINRSVYSKGEQTMSGIVAHINREVWLPRLLALSWLWIAVLPVRAQLTPPTGWTGQTVGNAIVLNSPADDRSSRVALTLLPPGRPQGEVKSWFANQSLALAQVAGRPLGSTAVMEQEGILIRVVQFENQNHRKLRAVFYGYPTRAGFTVAVLTIPPAVGDHDARLETANRYVQELAGKKFELAVLMPAVRPGPPAAVQPHTDIDLIYHAKPIPPKERDIPLKGVYLFVGFAFGPSYGGVGTTMTWSQKPSQQLLLLFANGVAAKVDLRGGNLAGKYQAEGFATMDVGNSASVSGAPFGHWADDGNAVLIQWNIGSPTDLTKSGENLEGKGERWTPFHLADSERLEGTFVRQMEAGLRSQWIVLHKDGTFTGDGVNVTMGGREVNPAFPEHGSGAYEVRKGSMILYFANGFTQAIACIIDATSTGGAKTVLLNGFPFQRVR